MTNVAPVPPSPAPAPQPALPQLPTWSDAGSVQSYATSAAAFVVAIITGVHPGFHEPAVVEALIPSAGLLVAGIAQAVNVITHRKAHTEAVIARIHAGVL